MDNCFDHVVKDFLYRNRKDFRLATETAGEWFDGHDSQMRLFWRDSEDPSIDWSGLKNETDIALQECVDEKWKAPLRQLADLAHRIEQIKASLACLSETTQKLIESGLYDQEVVFAVQDAVEKARTQAGVTK